MTQNLHTKEFNVDLLESVCTAELYVCMWEWMHVYIHVTHTGVRT